MKRNSDYLQELQVLVLAGLVVAAIGTSIGLVGLITGAPITTSLTVGMGDSADIGTLAEGVKVDPAGEISVEITSPTPKQRLLHALTQVPTAIVLLTALSLLAMMLRRARRTDPFSASTVRSLRLIGIALLAGVIADPVESAAEFLLSETISPDRFGATLQLPFVWLLGGLVCFAVAEMVRRGCRMRDELATVI